MLHGLHLANKNTKSRSSFTLQSLIILFRIILLPYLSGLVEMTDAFITYHCKTCGHKWVWTYLFVVKCQQCKTYHGFNEAAVIPADTSAEAVPLENPLAYPPPCQLIAPSPSRLALAKHKGGYSLNLWPISDDESGFSAAS